MLYLITILVIIGAYLLLRDTKLIIQKLDKISKNEVQRKKVIVTTRPPKVPRPAEDEEKANEFYD